MKMTIQQFAQHMDISAHTLRYYEKIGLIDPVDRADNGHRYYTEKDALRVNFLKRLRNTGMSIRKMQHYVELFRQGDATLEERLAMLEAHRARVLAQMQELEETLELLDFKIETYREQLGETS
jgi:DNA-binding transcriptional MerR regulator